MTVIRDERYPANVLRNKFLSKNAKLVYLYCVLIPDDFTIKEICQNLQLKENEVYEILDTLQTIGLLKNGEEF